MSQLRKTCELVGVRFERIVKIRKRDFCFHSPKRGESSRCETCVKENQREYGKKSEIEEKSVRACRENEGASVQQRRVEKERKKGHDGRREKLSGSMTKPRRNETPGPVVGSHLYPLYISPSPSLAPSPSRRHRARPPPPSLEK